MVANIIQPYDLNGRWLAIAVITEIWLVDKIKSAVSSIAILSVIKTTLTETGSKLLDFIVKQCMRLMMSYL